MGVFFVNKFYFTESQSFAGYYTWKYNVLGIKLATKVIRLHKIQVEKIS